MKIKYILFDLDGTLLPMDQDVFTKAYFKLLCQKAAPYGYEPKKLIDTVWAGTAAMVKNDGSVTNETAFWEKFSEVYGSEKLADKSIFDDFYANEFSGAKDSCGFNEKAAQTVHTLKKSGYTTVLATNPIFPSTATQARIRWAGLEPSDFLFCTSYENISHCKPNPEYYKDILKRLDAKAEECLMVGNDVSEDMIANTLGFNVFLLTDCMINKENKDISIYPNGGFDELNKYIKSME